MPTVGLPNTVIHVCETVSVLPKAPQQITLRTFLMGAKPHYEKKINLQMVVPFSTHIGPFGKHD